MPYLDIAKLDTYPPGYRYLAYCQEATMGVKVKLDLPGHRREGESITGQEHDKLYIQAKQWVEGKDVHV